MLPGLIVGGRLLSLPGLLQGIAINLGADGEIVTPHNVLVYERLPAQFSVLFWDEQGVARNRFALLVAASVCAGCGCAGR